MTLRLQFRVGVKRPATPTSGESTKEEAAAKAGFLRSKLLNVFICVTFFRQKTAQSDSQQRKNMNNNEKGKKKKRMTNKIRKIYKIGEWNCDQCGGMESAQHVLMECEQYKDKRKTWKAAMEKEKETFHCQVGKKTRLWRLVVAVRHRRFIEVAEAGFLPH